MSFKRKDALAITLLLLVLVLPGCRGEDGSISLVNVADGGDEDISNPNDGIPRAPSVDPAGQACYSGKNGSSCFPVIDLRDIEGDSYEYADPFRDPSFPANFDENQYIAPARVIDLRATSAQSFLTPHFQLGEFMVVGRGRYALFSSVVADIIESLRVHVGRAININSAYRSPERNGGVGGVKRSRHVYGDAIDFYSNGASLAQLKNACIRMGASFYQLYATHIHCDWRGKPLDPAFYDVDASSLSREEVNVLAAFQEAESEKLPLSIAREGDFAVLRVGRPQQEDEGELLVEWRVELPNGEVAHSTAPELRVPAQAGAYAVDVSVGDSVRIRGRKLTLN